MLLCTIIRRHRVPLSFGLSFSAADKVLKVLGIAGALHRNLRGGRFQLLEIVRREMHVNSSDVFFQPVQFRRSRNGDDPLLFCEQPSQSDLSWRGLLLFGEFTDQINERLIRVSILLGEAWNDIAEIMSVDTG
jgi:hypothetical protein